MNIKSKARITNYLPDQYERTGALHINHNYLDKQFADYPEILEKIAAVVRDGDFTLGKSVDQCEKMFAEKVGAEFALGVGSGTDALFLSLKALNIGEGDEVITTPFTFYATIGAIVTAGARPVFVDVKHDYNLDEQAIAAAITPRTRAILPVHWAGRPCELRAIRDIATRNSLAVVQDACHAIAAEYHSEHPVAYGDIACYSMHPLKNLNVWGDGGFVVTNNPEAADRIALLRNHGLVNRDTCEVFAYNSRLDTIQAVVAMHLMEQRLDNITNCRRHNALYMDRCLADVTEVATVPRHPHLKEVFHLYQINCSRRDELQAFLTGQGIDAKVHYPVPMHLQPAAAAMGYRRGDFPVAEELANTTLSFPVHEYVSESDLDFMAAMIKEFYQ